MALSPVLRLSRGFNNRGVVYGDRTTPDALDFED